MKWDATPTHLGASVWEFPPSNRWPVNDVVGRGADLKPATLIDAYRHGMFPMVSIDDFNYGPDMEVDATTEKLETEPKTDSDLVWWSPLQRGIIPLDGLLVTRSMRRSARKYEVRVNTCFQLVMRGCAAPHRDQGWITQEFIDAYTVLHNLGWAHSVEVFDENGLLAGGLYGVRIGGLFAGESMFHLLRDASKVALMALVEMMFVSRMSLLDVQWLTPHLKTLGAVGISRSEYLKSLSLAVDFS